MSLSFNTITGNTHEIFHHNLSKHTPYQPYVKVIQQEYWIICYVGYWFLMSDNNTWMCIVFLGKTYFIINIWIILTICLLNVDFEEAVCSDVSVLLIALLLWILEHMVEDHINMLVDRIVASTSCAYGKRSH